MRTGGIEKYELWQVQNGKIHLTNSELNRYICGTWTDPTDTFLGEKKFDENTIDTMFFCKRCLKSLGIKKESNYLPEELFEI